MNKKEIHLYKQNIFYYVCFALFLLESNEIHFFLFLLILKYIFFSLSAIRLLLLIHKTISIHVTIECDFIYVVLTSNTIKNQSNHHLH